MVSMVSKAIPAMIMIVTAIPISPSSLKWPDHGRENENYNPHHDRQRDPDLYEIGELVSTWAIDHKVGLIAHG
jgi:hypothetical protein